MSDGIKRMHETGHAKMAPVTLDLPDHPEKYMKWSDLERRCLQPYFDELARLRKRVAELEADNTI